MPLPVTILPSRIFALILLVAHFLALFALFAVLPLWAAVTCIFPLGASLLHYLLRDAWLRLGNACVGLAPDGDGMAMVLRDGSHLPCAVLKDSMVTPMFTVLRLRPEGARMARVVVILPDSMAAEAFRGLRVWLKWGGVAPASPDLGPAGPI